MSHQNYSKKQERERANNVKNNAEKTFDTDFERAKDSWRKYLSLWRAKPDLFIDFISDERTPVRLYAYQRMFLRLIFRYKEVYFVATRGTAKSYIAILAMFLKCIMYPNSKLFISAPGKQQATAIAKEKISEILNWYPALRGEFAKKPVDNKDYFRIEFKNTSYLDIVAMANSARGGRRTAGLIEEIADESVDPDILNESVLPMMALNRLTSGGKIDAIHEPHKQKIYITTAGRKQSYAYELAEKTIKGMLEGKNFFYFGAGYQLGTMYSTQLDLEDIMEKREKLTIGGFDREYESVWTGASKGALVSSEDMYDARKIKNAETEYTEEKKGVDFFYVLSYDVARSEEKENADSALAVFKVIDKGDGSYYKRLVNIIGMDGSMHFKLQAIELKQYVEIYKARTLIVDSNGLGKGVVDYLLDDIDENPPYSVINDESYEKYDKPNSAKILYLLSSNTKEDKASLIHRNFMVMIKGRDVEILIGESEKKVAMGAKELQKSDTFQKLVPFISTDLFVEEVMNLQYHQTGSGDIQVKQVSKRINKDKYSAVSYALWYIKKLEMENLENKGRVYQPPAKMMKIRKAKGF